MEDYDNDYYDMPDGTVCSKCGRSIQQGEISLGDVETQLFNGKFVCTDCLEKLNRGENPRNEYYYDEYYYDYD